MRAAVAAQRPSQKSRFQPCSLGHPDLRKSHLLVMRCTFNFCSAICELGSRFAALLGRFLPRLGPFVEFERPFFYGESNLEKLRAHSAAAR
jgi:hypothetical protein